MKTKIISILVFIVLLSGFSFIEKQKNDLKNRNLNGKVKSVQNFSYNAVINNGKISLGKLKKKEPWERKNRYIFFNELGNIIEDNRFKLDGSLDYKWTYKYDDKNNKIECISYNSDGSLYYKETYKYDDKNNIIEDNRFNSDGSLDEKETYKYDDKGNQIEAMEYNPKAFFYKKSKKTYKYDDKGNQIEWNYYGVNLNLEKKYAYKYDDKGNQIESKEYNSEGILKEKWTYEYEYDEKDNWIKKVEYLETFPKYILDRRIKYYD